MKTIIAGSREGLTLQDVITAAETCGWKITQVLSGTARGADKMGEVWADMKGVPIARYPADWNLFGDRAGHLRNVRMADDADALVAVWDGESPGTKDMIKIATQRGLKISVHRPI